MSSGGLKDPFCLLDKQPTTGTVVATQILEEAKIIERPQKGWFKPDENTVRFNYKPEQDGYYYMDMKHTSAAPVGQPLDAVNFIIVSNCPRKEDNALQLNGLASAVSYGCSPKSFLPTSLPAQLVGILPPDVWKKEILEINQQNDSVGAGFKVTQPLLVKAGAWIVCFIALIILQGDVFKDIPALKTVFTILFFLYLISSIALVCYILNKKAATSLNNVFNAIENANNTSFKGKIVMTWTPSQSSLDHKSPGTVVVGNLPEGYVIEKFCITIVSPSIVNTGV